MSVHLLHFRITSSKLPWVFSFCALYTLLLLVDASQTHDLWVYQAYWAQPTSPMGLANLLWEFKLIRGLTNKKKKMSYIFLIWYSQLLDDGFGLSPTALSKFQPCFVLPPIFMRFLYLGFYPKLGDSYLASDIAHVTINVLKEQIE